MPIDIAMMRERAELGMQHVWDKPTVIALLDEIEQLRAQVAELKVERDVALQEARKWEMLYRLRDAPKRFM